MEENDKSPSAQNYQGISRRLEWDEKDTGQSEVITHHNCDCIFRNCKKCGAINTLQESIIKQNPAVDWSKQVTWHQWQYILLDTGEKDGKKKQVIDKIRYRGPLAQLLMKFIQSVNAMSSTYSISIGRLCNLTNARSSYGKGMLCS